MSRANPRFHRINPTLPAVVPNVLQLTIFYTLDNQVCLNNLYYTDGTAVASVANLAGFLTGWQTANQASLLAVCCNDTALFQYKAQYLNQPSIIPQYLVTTAGTVGTGGSTHLPSMNAVVFSKASLIKGQSGRGRFYTVGVPPGVCTGSSLTPATAFITSCNTWITKMLATVVVGAINYAPIIFSRRGYNKITGVGGGWSNLNQVYLKVLLGTVRRRRIGRGK